MAVHRYTGLAAMVLLGFAALTGSALCFVRVLDPALNRDLFDQPSVAGTPPVAPLVARFAAAHPAITIGSFPLAVPADQRIPVKIAPTTLDGRPADQIFLDRGTGALAAARSDEPALNARGAMRLLHDIHYTLLAEAPGRWLMGVVALLWLIGNGVGFYLTLPQRGAFWKQWKRSWRFSFKSSLPRLILDLHRAPGLWLLLPFTALALTSVAMNFFGEAYEPLVNRAFPEPETEQAAPAHPGAPIDFAGAVALARAEAKRRDEVWRPATVTYSARTQRIGVTLTDDGTLNYHALGPIYLYFDRRDGHLADVADPYHGNRNLAWIRLLYPVHSGRIFGLATIALVFTLGLMTTTMCGTGVYVWLKKRPARKKARNP
jgi:uncharacterized iron-regulated membrane protein